jgi:hypothetical protein
MLKEVQKAAGDAHCFCKAQPPTESTVFASETRRPVTAVRHGTFGFFLGLPLREPGYLVSASTRRPVAGLPDATMLPTWLLAPLLEVRTCVLRLPLGHLGVLYHPHQKPCALGAFVARPLRDFGWPLRGQTEDGRFLASLYCVRGIRAKRLMRVPGSVRLLVFTGRCRTAIQGN